MSQYLKIFEYLQNYDFTWTACIAVILSSIVCGLISPLAVLKQRAYAVDATLHLIFPGIVVGQLLGKFLNVEPMIAILIASFLSAFLGYMMQSYTSRKLSVPLDAALILVLTGFFSLGIIVHALFDPKQIDLHHIFLGDPLVATSADLILLSVVLIVTCATILSLKKHWDIWLCDPEFAETVGVKTKILEILFPFILTMVILSTLFILGGLLTASLIVVPAVLTAPRSSFSLKTVFASVGLGIVGCVLAFQMNIPIGATISFVGIISSLCILLYRF